MNFQKKKILVLGSLAFDYIMRIDEDLRNNINLNHKNDEYLSLITVKSRVKYFGGTSGNILYNLGLLNIGKIYLIGSVGKDFETLGYKEHIKKFENVNLMIKIHNDLYTAACYIVNDINSNQIVIFHEGAQERYYELNLKEIIKEPENFLWAINSTQNVEAMIYYAEQLFNLRIPMIFDPGQKTSSFSKELLLDVIEKSEILIGNKYEISQIKNKTGLSENELMNQLKAIIITKGIEGSELVYKELNNQIFRAKVPIYKPEKEIHNTTGAGDGYRAGFLAGLLLNMSLLESCRLGSIISSFVIETQGAQTHFYKITDVLKRFLKNYSYIPKELESLVA